MRRAARSALCLLILALLGVALVVLSPPPARSAPRIEAPYRIVAGPYSKKERPDAVVTTSTFNLKGVTISAEFLDPDARAAFVRSIRPAMSDPFAASPGRPENYHAVRVAFHNDSSVDVVFQAGNVVLYTDGKTQEFGIDLTDLYRVAADAGADDPQGMIDRVAPLLYDSSTTIPKGKTTERLLLFGPLQGKWRELQMIFSFLQIGAETHTVSFTFHKQSAKG